MLRVRQENGAGHDKADLELVRACSCLIADIDNKSSEGILALAAAMNCQWPYAQIDEV